MCSRTGDAVREDLAQAAATRDARGTAGTEQALVDERCYVLQLALALAFNLRSLGLGVEVDPAGLRAANRQSGGRARHAQMRTVAAHRGVVDDPHEPLEVKGGEDGRVAEQRPGRAQLSAGGHLGAKVGFGPGRCR